MLINYILRPEVHASLTNTVFYANPNRHREVREARTGRQQVVFLSTQTALDTMIGCPTPADQAIRRVQTRIFTSFKAGR